MASSVPAGAGAFPTSHGHETGGVDGVDGCGSPVPEPVPWQNQEIYLIWRSFCKKNGNLWLFVT